MPHPINIHVKQRFGVERGSIDDNPPKIIKAIQTLTKTKTLTGETSEALQDLGHKINLTHESEKDRSKVIYKYLKKDTK